MLKKIELCLFFFFFETSVSHVVHQQPVASNHQSVNESSNHPRITVETQKILNQQKHRISKALTWVPPRDRRSAIRALRGNGESAFPTWAWKILPWPNRFAICGNPGSAVWHHCNKQKKKENNDSEASFGRIKTRTWDHFSEQDDEEDFPAISEPFHCACEMRETRLLRPCCRRRK